MTTRPQPGSDRRQGPPSGPVPPLSCVEASDGTRFLVVRPGTSLPPTPPEAAAPIDPSGWPGEPPVEQSGLLRRVAIVRGAGRAARLAAAHLEGHIQMAGGATVQFDGSGARREWTLTPRPVIDTDAYTLVVTVDAPLHAAEALGSALDLLVVEVPHEAVGHFPKELARALADGALSERPLLDVDVDGVHLVTGGPADLHADGTGVTVISAGGPVVVARDVRVAPAAGGAGGILIDAAGRVEPARDALVSAAGRTVHVRTPAGDQQGYAVRLAPRRPLRHLTLGGRPR